LLALVLKFLFLETPLLATSPLAGTLGLSPFSTSHLNPKVAPVSVPLDPDHPTEWVNVILQNIAQAYRRELKAGLEGAAGEDAARAFIQRWANEHRGTSLLDDIIVHSISLGSDAPKLRAARVLPATKPGENVRIECDIFYQDEISASLSTSILLHYPTPSFARLPVSLTMSLSKFSAKIIVTPPALSDPSPYLTISLDPSFVLDLSTHSLLGSRAKLSNVPKVHEMITQRIKKGIADRGSWKVLLPGVRA